MARSCVLFRISCLGLLLIYKYCQIDPKRAIPRQEHQRATKLFIGGLAGSVTSESMREFFSQFGRVVDSTVMLDRETGRSKGFGFVSFEDTNVQPFLGFGNLEIDGKTVLKQCYFSTAPSLNFHRFHRSMSNWHSPASSAMHIQVKKAVKTLVAAATYIVVNNKVVHTVQHRQHQRQAAARLLILKHSRRSIHGCSR